MIKMPIKIIITVITENHPMYTMSMVSHYFYEVVSDHFTDKETRASTVEVNLPKVSELVSGGARFQEL